MKGRVPYTYARGSISMLQVDYDGSMDNSSVAMATMAIGGVLPESYGQSYRFLWIVPARARLGPHTVA
jgi:hypothetical protein